MKRKKVHIALPEVLYSRMVQAMSKDGETQISVWVRQAIKEKIEREGKKSE